MAIEALISWTTPEHLHTEKSSDWYWSVGVITLTLAVVAFIFANVILGILIIVAVTTLVLHASRPANEITCSINDRGVVIADRLYPFLSLESFWVTHDEFPAKLIMKSRMTFMPLIVVYINEVDPEQVREILLRYIAEKEHSEHFLHDVLERFGF